MDTQRDPEGHTPSMVVCEHCEGYGYIVTASVWFSDDEVCPDCGGLGRVRSTAPQRDLGGTHHG